MRQILTIFHYELLLQIKSVRFKATCGLVLFVNFIIYMNSLMRQELDLRNYFLDFHQFPLFLVAGTFTGLYSIGRIRTSGMHMILMTKPFPTYALLLGQLLAGVAALLVPLCLLFFPDGLILRWQVDMDFPIPPIWHIILFFMIPWACCVMAVTIWVRTCFKNNLVSIIILTLFFAGAVYLSNKYLDSRGPEGAYIHRFVPMLSYFNKGYWDGAMRILAQSRVSFARGEDWINWSLSILYSNVFLMLAGYHLRRTEPQRKVLGGYGRRWYHTPTFLRAACDLKVDPHVTWRHHLIMALMIGFIVVHTVRPAATGFNYRVVAPGARNSKDDPYDPSRFPESRILHVKILDEKSLLTPERAVSDHTITIDGDTSGTAAFMMSYRFQYDMRSIAIDGKSVPFIRRKDNFMVIEGRSLKPFADGRNHHMHVESDHAPLQDSLEMGAPWEFEQLRSLFFTQEKQVSVDSDGEKFFHYYYHTRDTWPIQLTILKPAGVRLLDAFVTPEISREGKLSRFDFHYSAQQARYGGVIIFDLLGDFETLEPADTALKFRLRVQHAYKEISAELLELAEPVIRDYYTLHRINPERPIEYIFPVTGGNTDGELLKNIRKFRNRYRYRSWFGDGDKEAEVKLLNDFEAVLLNRIRRAGGDWFIRDYRGFLWDVDEFQTQNLTRGLNHRISLENQYEPPEYLPVNSHLDGSAAPKLENLNREECVQAAKSWPVFQMLYLVIGPEPWQSMVTKLRDLGKQKFLATEDVQAAAESASGQKLGWFFDYWLRTGRGLPCYQVISATGKAARVKDNGDQEFAVRVALKNLGTGRMPVPLTLETSRGPVEEKVWIGAGETATWNVTCKGLPKSVSVDPQGWILTKPRWIEGNKFWAVNATMDVQME